MSSIKCVIIDKNATLSCSVIKNVKEDELYKKCGYKSEKGFKNLVTWEVEKNDEQCYVLLFGKEEGRANSENKYDLPPPVDSNLFFGNLLLICKNKDDNYEDLTVEEWNKIYEYLFGGFEDLNSDSEESEDELENIASEMKTKDGYLKDGFVVDDIEDDDESYNEDDKLILDDMDSELEEEEYLYSDEDN
jgi:hypothetical protein